jgi:hypothetical protein
VQVVVALLQVAAARADLELLQVFLALLQLTTQLQLAQEEQVLSVQVPEEAQELIQFLQPLPQQAVAVVLDKLLDRLLQLVVLVAVVLTATLQALLVTQVLILQ